MKIKQTNIALVYSILCFLLSSGFMQAQNVSLEEAEKAYYRGNFRLALSLYKQLDKKMPDNVQIKCGVGLCYLYAEQDYEKAIPYLKYAEDNSSASDSLLYIHYSLARIYHLTNQFDKAIEYYQKVKKENNIESILTQKAAQNVEKCINAKALVQHPLM